MANYTAPVLQNPTGTAYKTAGFLWTSATLRRIQVYEAEFGQTGQAYASTDCSSQWDMSRGSTAAIVASTVVTSNLDPADSASATLFANNATTEPTYTAAGFGLALKQWGINQRGSYRWRALDDGDNIIVAATAGFGIGIRSSSFGFVGTAIGTLSFMER